MKKIWKALLIILFLLACVAGFFAYQLFLNNGLKGPAINGTIEKQTFSKEGLRDYGINQDIKLKIYLPPGYDTTKQYQMIFLLDGDDMFKGAAGYLSQMIANNTVPAAVLVGIGYGYSNGYLAGPKEGRWRDYSFPEDPEFGVAANGPGFYRFLSNLLVPDMKKKYPAGSNSIGLIGHSMCRDFTYYAFLQYDPALGEKNPFTHFILGDGGNEDHFLNVYMPAFEAKMAGYGGKTHTPLTIYRVWGYKTYVPGLKGQEDMHRWLVRKQYKTVKAYRYYPLEDDHAGTMKTTVVNGIKIILGTGSFLDYPDSSGFHF